jgi:hypothetical protein
MEAAPSPWGKMTRTCRCGFRFGEVRFPIEPGREERTAAGLIGAAAEALEAGLIPDPDRTAPGPLEVKEFGPALRDTLTAVLADVDADGEVRLGHQTQIADWNRRTTQVDLAVVHGAELKLVAELKVWDVGHQLFDVAKVCCLIKSGAKAGFLLCVAKSADAFESNPGGELFPDKAGMVHGDVFPILFQRHPAEARRHLKRNRPCPVSLPRRFSTTAVCDPVPLHTYPGHELRVVEVRIEDPTPTSVPPDLIADH